MFGAGCGLKPKQSSRSYVSKDFMLKTIWRWLWRSIALLIVLVLAYELWIFAHVWWYVDHNPGATAFMERRLVLLQEKMGERVITVRDEERQECEIWTRVMGYYRPVSEYNIGKKSEHAERLYYTENRTRNSFSAV